MANSNFLIIAQSNFTSVMLKNILYKNNLNVIGEINIQNNISTRVPEYIIIKDEIDPYKVKLRDGLYVNEIIDYVEEKNPTALFIDAELFTSEFSDKLQEKDIISTVILLTPMGQQYVAIEGIRIGADSYITKPFSEKNIIKEISDII